MTVNKNVKLLFVVLVLLGFCTPVYAFAGKAHKALTEKAILDSGTNNYLKNYLGIQQGLGTTLLLDQSTVPEPERIPSDQFEDRISSVVPAKQDLGE